MFGTLFKNEKFVQKLERVETETNFLSIFKHEIDMRMNFDKHHKKTQQSNGQLVGHPTDNNHAGHGDVYGLYTSAATYFPWWHVGRGIFIDYKRRLPYRKFKKMTKINQFSNSQYFSIFCPSHFRLH